MNTEDGSRDKMNKNIPAKGNKIKYLLSSLILLGYFFVGGGGSISFQHSLFGRLFHRSFVN